jgi:tetratricopeptide (TPR) repeat protein
MAENIRDAVLDRLKEIRLYKDQGIDDVVKELVNNVYREIVESSLSEKEKEEFISMLESELGPLQRYIPHLGIQKLGKHLDSDKVIPLDIESGIIDKLNEIKLYRDQGMIDIANELLQKIIGDIDNSPGLSDIKKRELHTLIEDELGSPEALSLDSGPSTSDKVESLEITEDPEKQFVYAKNLISIHNWDEAIAVLKLVAATGYKYEECYELCGDCAQRAGRYQEAIEYYEIVYSVPGLSEDVKKRIFDKIVKCRQKKFMEKFPSAKSSQLDRLEKESSLLVASYVGDLAQYVGVVLRSWNWGKDLPWKPRICSYKLEELMQVGNTWAVFEATRQADGRPYAAITLVPSWWECVSNESFAEWVYTSIMMESDYLLVPVDLSVASDGKLFVICPYYRQSLSEFLSNRTEKISLDEALVIGYQILEGLGYLHLHLGRDKQKRKIYHLDLRPSRIFFSDQYKVKVAYGGLWRMLSTSCPNLTNYRMLPLSYLAYKAPEQFRPYLWNPKKPLICTDVYQFGVVFYEILTGVNPFMGESIEEIEMLHCDQKPIPPQVFRPDLPEAVCDLVMGCLNTFPAKRWRSTTQILLEVEKMLGGTSRIREIMSRKKGEINDRISEM